MKRFKRIVGLLLCLAMVLSFVPVTHSHTHVHAAELEPATGEYLQIIPESTLTPYVGAYTDGVMQTLTDQIPSEAAYLTDMSIGTAGWIGPASTSGTQAAVIEVGGTKKIGAVELIARAADKLTGYEIQVKKTDGTWVTVATKSGAFSGTCSEMHTFDAVEGTAIRVLCKSWSSSRPMLQEITVYEVLTGAKLVEVPVTSVSSNKEHLTSGQEIENIIDGDRGSNSSGAYYQTNQVPVEITFNMTKNGEPSNVKRMLVAPFRPDKYSAKSVKVDIQTTNGGEWTQVYSNSNLYTNSTVDTPYIDFDQAYDVYAIRLTVNSSVADALILPEVKFFGYEMVTADPNVPAVPGTTQAGTYDYAKIPLSKSNVVGACSEGSTGKNYINESGDFSKVDWYTTGRPTWRDFSVLFDGIHTNDVHWGIDDTERGDFLLDLGESGTAVDRIKLYGAYYSTGYNVPTEITVMLLLKGGGTKTVVINTGWQDDSSARGALCTYDLDQTYTITGVYVWASSNGGSDEAIFGDFELWQKDPIQLPTPNLAEAAKTENSITVTANKLSPSTAGTLKFKIDDGAWQTATSGYYYTFTGLDAGSTHTIKAKYVANDSGYTDSPEATLSITTDAGVQRLPDPSNFTVTATSTNSITVTADLNANGKLKFRRSNSSKDNWATEWLYADANGSYTFTELEPNSMYQFQAIYEPLAGTPYTESNTVLITGTTSSCEHDYGNVCTGTTCVHCGETREAPGHIFTNCSQTECQRGCGYGRAAIEHSYTDCEDTTCNNANCDQTRAALTHVYDNTCDTSCNNCGAVREITHTYSNACDAECNVCGETRIPSDHVYSNACDADCNVCGETRVPAAHNYDSNGVCTVCGVEKRHEIVSPGTPTFGYYSDNNTNGAITDYYDGGYPPANLADGNHSNQTRSQYYLYDEVTTGAKIPVILFDLGEETRFSAVEVDVYRGTYYSIDDFTIQVYTEDGWVTVKNVTGAFGDPAKHNQVCDPELYTFDTTVGTKLRILITKLSDMSDYAYEDGEDDTELLYGSYIRLKEITLYEDESNDPAATVEKLPAPNLYESAVGETSITVDASANANGTLKFRINGGAWQNSGTFTGLTADTPYTIEAMYVGNVGYIDSDITTIIVNTTTLCEHIFDNACDTDCNNGCGYTRVTEHVYDNACDAECNICHDTRDVPDHVYSNACDTSCNVCGATRNVPDHVYDNACDTDCNECGEIRQVGAHDFSQNCDVCSICGYKKVNTSHVYDDTCADSDCNVCGYIREADHTYSNECDATCNKCGYVRDAAHVYSGNDGVVGTKDDACDATCDSCGTVRKITHVYEDVCDADCANCGQLRDAPHSIVDPCVDGATCSICGEIFATAPHVFTNLCDGNCNVCGTRVPGRDHVFSGADGVVETIDDVCDTVCDRCGSARDAIHVFSSIYDTECDNCGHTREALDEPTGLPTYPDKEQVTLNTPVFGYYSNNNTNGDITNWYMTGYGPELLIDGNKTDNQNRTTSDHYYYTEIAQGTKIPVILFTFSETVNVCSMNIYGYQYNYYNIEDFDVQVYTDGKWVTVAQITNAFTDGMFEEDVTSPLTVTFDKAYEASQLRILVRGITNMYTRGDMTTGDDIFFYKAPFRVREIEIFSTPVVVEQLDNVTINGAHVSQYQIVYSDDEPDYNETAAQYISDAIYKKTGYRLNVVEQSAASESNYEILVGETNRSLSATFDAPANNVMKFNLKASGTKIAMEADYFIIAGAAYYFAQKYIPTASGDSITVPETLQTLVPITEAPNNYIMMIGDGMGVMQTRLFEKYGAAPTTGTYGYSDGESIFYGYYFPYEGRSRTWNYVGQITDSAAGGSALSTGYKTINGYVGLDRYGNSVKNLSELAMEMGLSVAIMSTEGVDGATPADFSAHSDSRYNDDEILAQQENFGGLLVDNYNNYKQFTEAEWDTWEPLVKSALNNVAADPDGFFIMYEEAHIDKNCHRLNSTSPAGCTGDTSMETLFRTVYRFNQAIGIFMEYAMYNPDTVVLITADHETSGLTTEFQPTEENPVDEQVHGSVWNHSMQDVPVFAYGFGMEVFATDIVDKNDLTGEKNEYYQNASIGRTYAHFMTNGHADDFGDPWYPILVKDAVTEEYPEDPLTVKKNETLNKINGLEAKVNGSAAENLTDGDKNSTATINVPDGDHPAIITIDLTKNGKPTNIKKMIITATSASTGPATTIVEAQVEVNGELVWLQIYKDTLYHSRNQTGVLDFHTFYNVYQLRIEVYSVNDVSRNGFTNLVLKEIELYGYDVFAPDLGGVVTSNGNGTTTIQLMQNGAEVCSTTTTGRYYYIMDVAAGTYTLVATKDGHITAEYDITVGSDPVRQDVELKYVSSNTMTGVSQSVRLIEPWAIRSFIQYASSPNQPIYLTSILGYGAYAVIEHKAGDVAPQSWADIVYNEKAIQFEKSFTSGDEKISHTSAGGSNRRYTVAFDFYDMLYTYRMAEKVYWVTYYEDAEGIHFTSVRSQSMSDIIDTVKEEGNASADEVAVLDDMKALHQSLIDYRGEDADIGNTDYPDPVLLKDSGLNASDFSIQTYKFGRRHQIRLIEPWGFKVTLRVATIEGSNILDLERDDVDVGLIFYHDKVNEYFNTGMGSADILARSDALVYSKSLGNLTVNGDSAIAVFDQGIYTYQLDTEVYCLPYVKVGDQFYCQRSAVRWNVRDEMTSFRDDTTRDPLECDVFEDMVNLYWDVKKYLGF